MPKKYRKKPVVIEAVQWNGANLAELVQFCGALIVQDDRVHVATLEGDMELSCYDYLIKGIKGEFYPCKPDIFMLTYEDVPNESR